MRAQSERVEGGGAEVAGEHVEVDVSPAPRRPGRPKVGKGAAARKKKAVRKVQVDVDYAPIVHLAWVDMQEMTENIPFDGIFPRALATKQGVQIPIGMCSRCRQIVHNTADHRATHRAWCRNVTMSWKRRQRER